MMEQVLGSIFGSAPWNGEAGLGALLRAVLYVVCEWTGAALVNVVCAGGVLLVIYLVFHAVWRSQIRKTYYARTLRQDVIPDAPRKVSKRCAVIGAGPAGIVTAKELLEAGHDVTIFEKNDTFGGVFLYRDYKGGVYDGCVLTIGNYVMTFSDFFEPGDKYRFWTAQEYWEYLARYIEHFGVERRSTVYYNHEVLTVARASQDTWSVTAKSAKGKVHSAVFDHVAICNGAHQVPNQPRIKGAESSPITICHSDSYKRAAGDARFEGKRVVCMGIGETGADVAAHVAQVASDAYLSMRRTPHVVPRNLWNLGFPGDASSTRAMFYCHHMWISALHSFDQWIRLVTSGPKCQAFFKGDMGMGCPVHAKAAELAERSGGLVVEQFLTKNDNFIPHLLDGSLKEKPDIDHIEGRRVYFTDGSFVDDVDTIIQCTGFVDSFPFLQDVDMPDVRHLYKHMIHPDIGPSLAWIGFVRPGTGGVPACAELCARYFALLASGERKLPDDWRQRIAREANMEEDLINISSGRVKTLVLYGDFMEAMAQHVDCQPMIMRYLFTDPVFWLKLLYGAMSPIQFRLRGPNARPEFAKACLKAMPAPTPIPFRVFQSMFAVAGWITGTLFGFRPPSW